MSITEIPGVRVGHWTDDAASTGCTVVLFPDGTVASGEVRGGAPATREWELLSPERLVARLDAVVLSGGSAFGLAACDGVVRFCEERGMGYPTAAGPVPVVVGTNVTLDKTGCLLVARAGHDGLARALWPVHTTVDGDALVAASVGGQIAPVDVVAALANEAVALAVENALGDA